MHNDVEVYIHEKALFPICSHTNKTIQYKTLDQSDKLQMGIVEFEDATTSTQEFLLFKDLQIVTFREAKYKYCIGLKITNHH